jgi:hypothetical protein
MARKPRGNFERNYPRVIKYLEDHDIDYMEYNGGQHLRILGPVSLVDLWPSRMVYHVIESEIPPDTKYHRPDDELYDEKLLNKLLLG